MNTATGEIEDKIESNNGDSAKVLATVAQIIYQFTGIFPTAFIFIMGSTPARTRLYQINLNKYWHELDPLFEVFGLQNGKWDRFRNGINYDAFVGRRKL